jgi:hypothetical protein
VIENGIGVFEKVVPHEICEGLISLYEARASLGKKVSRNFHLLHDEKQFYAREPEGDQSGWSDCLLNHDDTFLYAKIADIFWEQCYKPYTEEYPLLNEISRHNMGYLSIQKTKPARGYHSFHCEQGSAAYGKRLGFFILYLNTVEDGGETEFLYQSKRVKPVEGTIVIAPASYMYAHRGNPPLTETKYIVTSWIEFQE